jgi:LPS-assembly lipoprotein
MSARLLLAMWLGLLLAGCGFHLRGQAKLPFETLYLQAANEYSPLAQELRNGLQANGVRLTKRVEEASVVLQLVSEHPERKVLTLGSGGRVLEYQLSYHASLRLYDQQQNDWLPVQEIVIRRDFPWDDTQILAKQQEEILLNENMRNDMVQQIIRRLSFAKRRTRE